MNLADAFWASANKHADKTALFWGESEFSYKQLLVQSRAVGQHLQAHYHLRPGDRVGVWLKNCPEFVPSLFGALMAGGIVVPINNFLKPDEVRYIMEDSGFDILITDRAFAEAVSTLSTGRPTLKPFFVESIASLETSIQKEPDGVGRSPGETDLAFIAYTSGMTGHPKGAMLTHGNLLANVDSCRQVLAAVDHDRFVVLLPMFHSFMLCVGVLLPLMVGGSIVLVKSIHPPKNVLQEIHQRRATILPAIPQFFRALLDSQVPTSLPLRLCICGAAPLPVETIKAFDQKFPIPLIEGYGLTEASPVVSMNPLNSVRKPGSIGIPIPGVEVSIQDENGNTLPEGENGEICIRGANVMKGYWNQPEETSKALRNGWLLTGDVGYRDEDGYFFITDRKKDMLLVNVINF